MLSFHVKFVQTDRWMDRQTTIKQYSPMFRCRGIKKKKKNLTLFLLHAGKTIDSLFVLIPTGTVPESNHAS